jgi:hypothetical protein
MQNANTACTQQRGEKHVPFTPGMQTGQGLHLAFRILN